MVIKRGNKTIQYRLKPIKTMSVGNNVIIKVTTHFELKFREREMT